jgi:hypothetical protein
MEANKLDLIISKRENDVFRHNYVGFPMLEVFNMSNFRLSWRRGVGTS